ncbi:hypothetical protein CANARDRAFT_30178 [[Candida] arabinofermentans NRRL YB-2248]|uniref:non-specific serine/threonine protein kinase n=1 Tax=[Candida] arabinofermentans NRRL YB-2248 TaxID=983967 RepID=A0A1E4SUR0_9ASCO|nr:hypothetical protein CANARDRAFT_30178 [[Candida] arabinofermentans NRRL YB-2248]
MHRHQLSKNYSISSSSLQPNDLNGEENPFLTQQEQEQQAQQEHEQFVIDDDSTELSETVSFAHRDIKPANIMISKEGIPILCDLGSCEKARINIQTRAQAITFQELSNEHCTLPYRAPELLDIKVGDQIDEKIDIWSLGCTLYALLYGYSPFEREELINGANITLAISSGNFTFPNNPDFNNDLKDLIKFCLIVEPNDRPSIEDVLNKALELQRFRR